MELPLRIACEREALRVLRGGAACLDENSGVTASSSLPPPVLVLGESGVVALAPPSARPSNWRPGTDRLPRYAMSLEGGAVVWWRLLDNDKRELDTPQRLAQAPSASEISSGAVLDAVWAERIVRATHSYYSKQVLEPAVRGFLGILEKQFPRSDLYIWELLQNAVDDGASHVVLERHGATDRHSSAGLHFSHNGRKFSPLDVLGLCSVGLSTKALSGKRSIGFMGIGFKAVYKRFSRVTVGDGTNWHFRFDEPRSSVSSSGNNNGLEPRMAWVLKPQAMPFAIDPNNCLSRDGWCTFELERPRGSADLSNDVRPPPAAVPVLLGRNALDRLRPPGSDPDLPPPPETGSSAKRASWTLEWDGDAYVISRERWKVLERRGACERLVVTRRSKGTQSKNAAWLFFSSQFVPDAAARAAYEEHTKRSHSGEHEEVTMFFPVDPVTGQPRGQEVKSSKSALGASHAHLAVFLDGPSAGGGRSSGGGRASAGRVASGTLHATLPTKVKLTGMPMHLNSGFLLSVDRQNVEVNQNAWNRALLGQLPRLLRLLLTWVASTEATQSDAAAAATTSSSPPLSNPIAAAYALMPPLRRSVPASVGSSTGQKKQQVYSGSRGRLWTSMLGEELSLSDIDDAMRDCSIVPVCGNDGAVQFTTSDRAIWVPPAFAALLPSSYLKRWLGGYAALATHVMGATMSASPLWRGLPAQPDANFLARMPRTLSAATITKGGDVVDLGLRLLAAFAAASMEGEAANRAGRQTKEAGGERATDDNDYDERAAEGVELRPISEWPLWLTAQGYLVRLSQIRFFDEEVAGLPSDLRADLEPALLPQPVDTQGATVEQKDQYDGSGGDNWRGRKRGRPHSNSHSGQHNRRNKPEGKPVPRVYALHPDLEMWIRGKAQMNDLNSSDEDEDDEDNNKDNGGKKSTDERGHESRMMRDSPRSSTQQRMSRVEHAKERELLVAAAQHSLGLAKDFHSGNVAGGGCSVSIDEAIAATFQGFAQKFVLSRGAWRQQQHGGLDEASIAVVLRLSNWALQERRPELITHALVESGAYDATVFALLPVATTYVGGAYDSKLGANLEDAASESHACTSSSELAFISTRYLYSSSSSSSSSSSTETSLRKALLTSFRSSSSSSLASAAAPRQHSEGADSSLSLSPVDTVVRHKWCEFWRSAGAQTAIGFAATTTEVRKVTQDIVEFLPTSAEPSGSGGGSRGSNKKRGRSSDGIDGVQLPPQRKKPPSGSPRLPHGLGVIQKHQWILVDSAFSDEWLRVLRSLSSGHGTANRSSSQSRAVAFARALSRSMIDTAMVQLSGATIPAARDAFKPVPDNSNSSTRASSTGARVGSASATDGYRAAIRTKEAVPARRRLYWLPPGQAGASALDMGPSRWVLQLREAKWVPAAARTGNAGHEQVMLFPPRQVLLKPDPSRPAMPVAALPADVLLFLGGGASNASNPGSGLGAMMEWGTESPPPPVDRLLDLMKEARECTATTSSKSLSRGSSDNGGGGDGEGMKDDHGEYYLRDMHRIASEMVPLWRSVATAAREAKLTPRDRQRLQDRASSLVLPTIGAHTTEPLLPFSRCLALGDTRGGEQGSGAILLSDASRSSQPLSVATARALGRCLCEANYVLDCSDPRWALSDVASDIALLLNVPRTPSVATAKAFLDWLPSVSSQSATLTSSFRSLHGTINDVAQAAYCASLFAMLESCTKSTLRQACFSKDDAVTGRSDAARQAARSSALAQARAALRRCLPDLLIYVHEGPSMPNVRNDQDAMEEDGHELSKPNPMEMPAGWVRAWGATTGNLSDLRPVMPVLDDDLSGTRRSFLRPFHRLQVLGVLTMKESKEALGFGDEVMSRQQVESCMVDVLGVLRLSSAANFTLRTRVKGSPELLEEASDRLHLVLAMIEAQEGLEELVAVHDDDGSAPLRKLRGGALGRPKLFRYQRLGREFIAKLPISGSKSSLETMPMVTEEQFCTWARLKGGKQLLLSGDADDYHIEISDLITAHVAKESPRAPSPAVALSSSAAASSWMPKLLRLLLHLEKPASFLKFLERDFTVSKQHASCAATIPPLVVAWKVETARVQRQRQATSVLRELLTLGVPAPLLRGIRDEIDARRKSKAQPRDESTPSEEISEAVALTMVAADDDTLQQCVEALNAATADAEETGLMNLRAPDPLEIDSNCEVPVPSQHDQVLEKLDSDAMTAFATLDELKDSSKKAAVVDASPLSESASGSALAALAAIVAKAVAKVLAKRDLERTEALAALSGAAATEIPVASAELADVVGGTGGEVAPEALYVGLEAFKDRVDSITSALAAAARARVPLDHPFVASAEGTMKRLQDAANATVQARKRAVAEAKAAEKQRLKAEKRKEKQRLKEEAKAAAAANEREKMESKYAVDNGSVSADDQAAEDQEDEEWEANDGGKLEAFSQSLVMEQRAAMGRGRGVSNLPSWMTTGATVGRNGMMTRDAPDERGAKGAPESDGLTPVEATTGMEAKSTANRAAPPAMMGRGRGVTNLPAWMTSWDGPAPQPAKRSRDESSNSADEVPGSDTYKYSHEEGRRGGSEAKRSRHESNRYQSRSSGRNRNKRRRLLGLVRALVDQAPEFLMRQLFPHETWQQEGDEGRTGANNNKKDDDDDDDGKGAETGDICTKDRDQSSEATLHSSEAKQFVAALKADTVLCNNPDIAEFLS